MTSDGARAGEEGTTLIEALVAAALLALLCAYAVGALKPLRTFNGLSEDIEGAISLDAVANALAPHDRGKPRGVYQEAGGAARLAFTGEEKTG